MRRLFPRFLIFCFPVLMTGWGAPRSMAAGERLAVLTFDDACLSHRTVVAPLLKKYGFGATFFICEYPGMWGRPDQAMTWAQIRELHDMGFEIGNHTRTHRHMDRMTAAEMEEETGAIEQRCAAAGIPRPVSFACPAYVQTPAAEAFLQARGYRRARVGGGRGYDPAADSPYRIPSISTTGHDPERVLDALRKVGPGQVAVLTVHGVPDAGHPNVTTPPELFERYLAYLKAEQFTVVALKDLPEAGRSGPPAARDWKAGIGALPPAEQEEWRRYLEKSGRWQTRQRAALAAEPAAGGKPVRAPAGETFRRDRRHGDPGSPEAGVLAARLLTWQLPCGGWTKGVDYTMGPRAPGMAWTPQNDPWHYAATLDNRATTEPLAFLAARYGAVPEERVAEAVRRGVRWLLDARFPCGGWPQVYPLEGGYHDAITLNDGSMLHALEVLTLVRDGAGGFGFLPAEMKAEAGQAVEAGIRCLLRCQIQEGGRPAVWCAQHDPVTLAPVGARAYEPASFSGAESCETVRFLMTLPHPDAAVTAAVEGALAWFEAARLPGEKPGDRPRWARFYDLKTRKPVFQGKKDHVIYPDFASMARHNPVGYDYFTEKPGDLTGKWADRWRRERR